MPSIVCHASTPLPVAASPSFMASLAVPASCTARSVIQPHAPSYEQHGALLHAFGELVQGLQAGQTSASSVETHLRLPNLTAPPLVMASSASRPTEHCCWWSEVLLLNVVRELIGMRIQRGREKGTEPGRQGTGVRMSDRLGPRLDILIAYRWTIP